MAESRETVNFVEEIIVFEKVMEPCAWHTFPSLMPRITNSVTAPHAMPCVPSALRKAWACGAV